MKERMSDVIRALMYRVTDELVITSPGTISREVFAVCDRPENLYLMGAMGCALGVGIGLALNTKQVVVVFAGDGDILMSLGTLALMKHLDLRNLRLFIMDNGSYAMTGCQATCSGAVDFTAMTRCHRYRVVAEKTTAPRIPLSPLEISERFHDATT